MMYKIFKIKETECLEIVKNLTSVLNFANKICSKCCDIKKLETRIELLKKKAKEEQIEIPEDVIEFIASEIQTNTIKLLGTFLRIFTFVKFTNSPFTIETVKEAFKNFKIKQESSCEYCPYNKMKNSISNVINKTKTNQIKN